MHDRTTFPWRVLVSFGTLIDDGFICTNIYGDGVIRMERKLPNGDSLYTFIGPEGDYRPPTIWEGTIERLQAEWAAEDDRAVFPEPKGGPEPSYHGAA